MEFVAKLQKLSQIKILLLVFHYFLAETFNIGGEQQLYSFKYFWEFAWKQIIDTDAIKKKTSVNVRSISLLDITYSY